MPMFLGGSAHRHVEQTTLLVEGTRGMDLTTYS